MRDYARTLFELGTQLAVDPPRVIATHNANRQVDVERRRRTQYEQGLTSLPHRSLEETAQPAYTGAPPRRAWVEHGGAQKGRKSSRSTRPPFVMQVQRFDYAQDVGSGHTIDKREWWRHHLKKNLEEERNAVGSRAPIDGRVFAPPRY